MTKLSSKKLTFRLRQQQFAIEDSCSVKYMIAVNKLYRNSNKNNSLTCKSMSEKPNLNVLKLFSLYIYLMFVRLDFKTMS